MEQIYGNSDASNGSWMIANEMDCKELLVDLINCQRHRHH